MRHGSCGLKLLVLNVKLLNSSISASPCLRFWISYKTIHKGRAVQGAFFFLCSLVNNRVVMWYVTSCMTSLSMVNFGKTCKSFFMMYIQMKAPWTALPLFRYPQVIGDMVSRMVRIDLFPVSSSTSLYLYMSRSMCSFLIQIWDHSRPEWKYRSERSLLHKGKYNIPYIYKNYFRKIHFDMGQGRGLSGEPEKQGLEMGGPP